MVNLPGPDALGIDTSLPAGDGVLAAPGAPGLGVAASVLGAAQAATSMDTGTLSGASASRAAVVQYAQRFVGDPYVWGGTRPGGFDCSGLTQYVLAHAGGINLPRVSYEQANAGSRVDVSQLQPGDLVAWDEGPRNKGADHIAIYAGNGKIIEAPHTGANVRVRSLGANEGAWGVHLTYAGD